MGKFQIYSKKGRIIQLIIIALVLTSCAGRLDRPRTPSTVNPKQPNIKYHVIDFDRDKEAYNAAVDAAIVSRDFSKATILRDRMINKIRIDIELNYREYVSQLFLNKANIDFAADVATLGLAFATTITGGESAKTVLAAITTLFVGSRLSFDNNFFREKTTEIIINQMNASRVSINTQILSKMVDLNVEKYSFNEAYVELIELFYAGTLQGAIQGLSAEAGKAASDAKEAAEKLTEDRIDAVYDCDANCKILDEFWRPGEGDFNVKNQNDILEWMKFNELENVPIVFFVEAKEYKDKRQEAVKFFKLPKEIK